MIAPLRSTESTSTVTDRRLGDARRAVARSLLPTPKKSPVVRPIATWKAWMLVGWMGIVAACYILRMLGIGR